MIPWYYLPILYKFLENRSAFLLLGDLLAYFNDILLDLFYFKHYLTGNSLILSFSIPFHSFLFLERMIHQKNNTLRIFFIISLQQKFLIRSFCCILFIDISQRSKTKHGSERRTWITLSIWSCVVWDNTFWKLNNNDKKDCRERFCFIARATDYR